MQVKYATKFLLSAAMSLAVHLVIYNKISLLFGCLLHPNDRPHTHTHTHTNHENIKNELSLQP
jgi:hypothetical protein